MIYTDNNNNNSISSNSLYGAIKWRLIQKRQVEFALFRDFVSKMTYDVSSRMFITYFG